MMIYYSLHKMKAIDFTVCNVAYVKREFIRV